MTTFSSEKQLHELIESSIQDESFNELITTDALFQNNNNSIVIPHFSIDYIAREKLLKSASNVLESLGELYLLTSDDNISVSKNEILRPDIVAISHDTESIVLFEIKISNQTGRQTLTEVLAYEQEIKNLMPMLSNYDFKFVIISTEWSTLLQHSVTSAVTWSNRKILCLNASLTENQNLLLNVFIPNAWKNTGNVYISKESMPCTTLCLYDYNNEADGKEDELDYRIITAFENIVHTGNNVNAHGFVILWKDSFYNKFTATKYNITICGISPYDLFQNMFYQNLNEIDSKKWLVDALSNYINEYAPSGHSESLYYIANSSNALLETFVNPCTEGDTNWHQEIKNLSYRADVILCDFFGLIGEYARSYIFNPDIRKSNINQYLNENPDWKNPINGLRLINNLSKPYIFEKGQIRCSDAFKLGNLIGIDSFLRGVLQNQEHEQLQNKFLWNLVSLLEAYDEITLIVETATNIEQPSPMKFSLNYKDSIDYETQIKWYFEELFSNSSEHHLFFTIGVSGHILFDDLAKRYIHEENIEELRQLIAENLCIAINLVLSRYRLLKSENGFYADLEETYNTLIEILELNDNEEYTTNKIIKLDLGFEWQFLLECSDKVLDSAFHSHKPINFSEFDIDWEYLKQGIREMRERGENDAGVILSANGNLGTGRVFQHFGANPSSPPEDNKVYFLNEKSGLGVVQTVSWEELMNGDVLL